MSVYMNTYKKVPVYTLSPSIAITSELGLSFGIIELSVYEKLNSKLAKVGG